MTTSKSGRAATDRNHVVGLDAIRFAAASLVMCYHLVFWNWGVGQPFARMKMLVSPSWGSSLHFGWVGVEIFFVISGFVIAYSASRTTSHAFFKGRFLRLAPVCWVAATLVLIIKLLQGTGPSDGLSRLYLETLAFWPFDAIDGVWWTLGIEVSFYGLVYVLISRGRSAALEAVVVPIGLLSGVFWAASLALQTLLEGRVGGVATLHALVLKAEGNRELQLLLIQHGCLFALGVVIWKASVVGLTPSRAVALALLGCACLLEIVGQNGIIARAAKTALSPWPALLTWSVAVASLVMCIVWNDWLVDRVGKGLAGIRFAGLATYPLYLIHNVVAVSLVAVSAPRVGLVAVGLGAIAAIAAAAFIAGVVEPPVRGVLSAVLKRSGAIRFERGSHAMRTELMSHDQQVSGPSSATVPTAELHR